MPAGMLMCIQEYSENIKRAICDIQTLKRLLSLLFEFFVWRAFYFLVRALHFFYPTEVKADSLSLC